MEKKLLFKKLTDLFELEELNKGFKSQDAAISWSNKVAPLLKFINPQYYSNFIHNSHKLNLNLSNYTTIPTLKIMKSQIEMAIEELKLRIELEEGLPDEMYFQESSQLDIQKNISRIIRQSNTSLWICDGYMDEKIIEELTEVSAQEIKLLTKQPKNLFKQRLAAAKQQFTSKIIEARKSDKFHDRYYIIDQDHVWALGSSYNNAGKKSTFLSRIKNEAEKQKIIADFGNWWSYGIKVS